MYLSLKRVLRACKSICGVFQSAVETGIATSDPNRRFPVPPIAGG